MVHLEELDETVEDAALHKAAAPEVLGRGYPAVATPTVMDAAKAQEARLADEAKADRHTLQKKGFFGGETGQKEQRRKGAAIKKGFLNSATETLYGPEGSPEGEVSDEVKMNRMNQEANEKMNKMMKGREPEMKADTGPEPAPAPWYTPEWPKNCQYNQPDCTLSPMETSTHNSDLAKDMVRKTERWQKALAGEDKEIRLAFSSLADEDVKNLLEALGKNERVEAMDLSHNNIQDVGIQTIVTFLATKDHLPRLRELRLYENQFGALGTTMVMQGLKVFRPQLRVLVEPPEFMLKCKS